MRYSIAFFIIFIWCSCSEEKKNSSDNSIFKDDFKREVATDVNIIYSDSSVVKMRIKSPLMYRYTENQRTIEEFPDGLLVEFFDPLKRVSSWLEADYAIRKESDQIVLIKQNVTLYNKKNDKLETEELIYDSNNSKIYTDKFVKITQPIQGDTSYGYGFITDQDFNRFEMNIYSGIKKVEELEKILGDQ